MKRRRNKPIWLWKETAISLDYFAAVLGNIFHWNRHFHDSLQCANKFLCIFSRTSHSNWHSKSGQRMWKISFIFFWFRFSSTAMNTQGKIILYVYSVENNWKINLCTNSFSPFFPTLSSRRANKSERVVDARTRIRQRSKTKAQNNTSFSV
jgi:hypothetical protein